ncbi:MAG: CHAD domain-containing protein [Thiohalobacteraceae bacterium]|nr:CHAD domain-containing protein [Gammaproteobacteria bacterium]
MTRTAEQSMDDTRLTLPTSETPNPMAPLLAMPATRAAAIIASVQLDKVREGHLRLTKHPDGEALHDFRVGLRQLRSTLDAYPEAFPSLPKKLRKRMRRLARDTSEARDSEVQLDWLRRQERQVRGEGALGFRWLLRQIELRTAEAYRELRNDVLEDFGYIDQRLCEVLAHNEALDTAVAGASPGASLGHLCADHLTELVDELAFHLHHIETREDEDQVHAARIYGKRIRYLLAPLRAESKGCESVVRRLQRLQNLLGEYHDAQVFGDVLRRRIRKASTGQAERWLELMLNTAPDARALARERKQDMVTGVLLVARLVAKRKEKLFQQLGRMQAQGEIEQLLHDIAMLATDLAAQSDAR